MKKRCLPPCLIVRNACLALTLIAGSLMVAANLSASANNQQLHNEALRRMFVYQILLNVEQQQ